MTLGFQIPDACFLFIGLTTPIIMILYFIFDCCSGQFFFLKIPMSAIKKSKEFRGLACILSRLNSLATYYSYKTWFACLLMSPRKAETINHIIFTIICSQLYQPVPKENFNVTTENVSRHPLCVMRTGIVDLVTIRTKKIVVCIHCLRLIYCVRACGSVDKELVSQS